MSQEDQPQTTSELSDVHKWVLNSTPAVRPMQSENSMELDPNGGSVVVDRRLYYDQASNHLYGFSFVVSPIITPSVEGGWLLLNGNRCRKLSWKERLRLFLGLTKVGRLPVSASTPPRFRKDPNV